MKLLCRFIRIVCLLEKEISPTAGLRQEDESCWVVCR